MSGFGNYDFTVPVQTNNVRGPTGDLTKIRANFEALASLVSAAERAGTAPAQVLSGMRRGTLEGESMFRDAVSGAANDWLFQRAGWQTWMSAPSGLGIAPIFAFGTSGILLDQLVEVAAPSPSNGQSLLFSGSTWSPVTVAAFLDDLSPVNAPSPASGEVLAFDGAEWVAAAPASHANDALDDLSDVTAPSPTSGQGLVYDGALWRPASVPGGALQVLTAELSAPSGALAVSGITQEGTRLLVYVNFPGSGTAGGSLDVAVRFNNDASVVYSSMIRHVLGNGSALVTAGGNFFGAATSGAICGRQNELGISTPSGVQARSQFTMDRYAVAAEGKRFTSRFWHMNSNGTLDTDLVLGYASGWYRKHGAVSAMSIHASLSGSVQQNMPSGTTLVVQVFGD